MVIENFSFFHNVSCMLEKSFLRFFVKSTSLEKYSVKTLQCGSNLQIKQLISRNFPPEIVRSNCLLHMTSLNKVDTFTWNISFSCNFSAMYLRKSQVENAFSRQCQVQNQLLCTCKYYTTHSVEILRIFLMSFRFYVKSNATFEKSSSELHNYQNANFHQN